MLRPSKLFVFLLAMTIVMAAAPSPAAAQDVRVRLVDEDARQPLAGVLVAALDRAGAIGTTTLSSIDGIAMVHLAGSGPYRLLIRRIGFAPVTTDTLALPALGSTLEIVVPARRIVLGTVRVVGNQTCSNQTESPSPAAEPAWTQVRAALEASALTRDQRLVTTAAFRFQRDLRVDGTVNFADTALRGRSGERPFVAPAPAALERDGYFKHKDDGSDNFYAPDEAVLLSPGFTQHHCVTQYPDVRRDSTGTQIALAFAPRDRDNRPEIKGLIWIDSATSELRRIDFEYVRISLRAPADSLGGSVSFQHLASGAWIVSGWALRMPRFSIVDARVRFTALIGYIEVGGTARVTADISIPGPNVPRTIVGSVFDSLSNRPLSGAHVQISDLGRDAVADSLGRFRFDSVAAGVHSLFVDHRALDDVGLFSIGASVDATPQLISTVAIATPSFATLWSRACGRAKKARAEDGFVFGTVRDSGLVTQDSPAMIDVAWRDSTRKSSAGSHASARADSTGSYAICGVPATQIVAVTATHAHIGTLPVSLRLGSARVARRDFTIAPVSTALTGIADMAPVEFSSLRASSVPNAKALAVRVQSLDGNPIAFANVIVEGGDPLITNEKGEVGLGNGRPRALTIRVRRIGFSEWFGNVEIPDTASTVTITLAHISQQLGAVRIIGKKNPSSPFVQGFYDRWLERQKGALSATFIGPEELEFRHPDAITNVLRGLLGVRLVKVCDGPQCQVAMSSNQACKIPMAVIFDGMQQLGENIAPMGAPPVYRVMIDKLIDAHDVMGVEVYARGGNMPLSLQVNDNICGVIAIWTGSRK
jgi:hypothetical protein